MKEKKNPLFLPAIITSSGNVSIYVRIRDVLLTVLLWLVYAYLLHDVYFFLLDIYHWLHDGDATIKAYPKLRIFDMLQNYGEGLLAMALAFIGWALYNRIRFINKKRRKKSEPVTIDELGRMYKIDSAELESWQKKRSLVVHNDDKGRVTSVEVAH